MCWKLPVSKANDRADNSGQIQDFNAIFILGVVVPRTIFHADIQFVEHFCKHSTIGLYKMIQLQLWDIFLLFAIDIHLIVLISILINRNADTTFYIIFASVNRTENNVAIFSVFGLNNFTTFGHNVFNGRLPAFGFAYLKTTPFQRYCNSSNSPDFVCLPPQVLN